MAPPSATTSVQVALRIRPQTNQDTISIPTRFQRSVIHAISPTAVSIETTNASAGGNATSAAAANSPAKKQSFAFDQVHQPSATQYELFASTAEPLTARFLEGYNCTILAYGQTSSGKTFTMTGIDLDADPADPTNGMGIIPRAVSTIFSRAKRLREERAGAWQYNLKGSFIEIYNEDLIDLLSTDDGRREVQIREDKDGHIIWGGLREVNVKGPYEVMSLLRQGTALRRTNETDMNAQSSRSHAIFSLTLTQKKYTGSGPPPRSSSPMPPAGRSPSRLARPGSVYTPQSGPAGSRIASPTLGRPSTPSFASAMGRGTRDSLRPGSSLGNHGGDRSLGGDDDRGEWVTIVSKFHFVDLAGSERLKRTGAAGERIKEGISINSGLLALGNVISALGDPARARAHTATHIPYRDSKLTRLLQDSLGGNAHTFMIACVSPAEYNAAETLNTLKYANRARNIKNRAVLNEREEGWEDVEWLQGTVTRLRKELKVIKEGGGASITNDHAIVPTEIEGAGKKVLSQLTELQNNYEDLREKFVERTSELTRLRQELGERHRGTSGGSVGGTGKYEEIVGPVIEEYEKTISAMEAELSLNRAALRHTNEMVEEKEEELASITDRHAATELYLEELRGRVTKLQEREATTEAYIRDLEEKMRSYDETSVSSSESMTDLKREVARFRDTESHSTSYIAELEARLARQDDSVITLQQTTERLEKECERRRNEVELLQTRLAVLKEDGEGWRADLDKRERRVKELEAKMEGWEQKRKDAGDARERLGNVVGEVTRARRSLQVDIPNEDALTPGATDSRPSSALSDQSLNERLLALQETHTATLADLSSMTAKYRDALREISDLAAQIQEAKLGSAQVSAATEDSIELSPRRGLNKSRSRDTSDPQIGKRLFFRHAASAESLHLRSQSQSLSQELSTARTRQASISSHGTSTSVSNSPPVSHGSAYFTNGHVPRPNLSISLPSPFTPSINGERSVSSLEKEIMRLQEVLKERESEISVLEESLRTSKLPSQVPEDAQWPSEAASRSTNGLVTPPSELAIEHLSPQTISKFDLIKNSMGSSITPNSDLEREQSESDELLDRLNELMLSMAQKESHHKEAVDTLNTQLASVRREHDVLQALSRDQAANMSSEIESMRSKHEANLLLLEKSIRKESELAELLEKADMKHAEALASLQAEHESALASKAVELESILSRMNDEHADATARLQEELSRSTSAIEKLRKDHEKMIEQLKEDHDESLRRRLDDVTQSAQRDSDTSLQKVREEYEEILRQKSAEAAITLQTTEEEYYNALTKLRKDHAAALEKHTQESDMALQRLRDEHADELKQREAAKQNLVSETESSQSETIKTLEDAHAAAITRKEASFAEKLESLKAERALALETQDGDYQLRVKKLKAENDRIFSQAQEDWRVEMEKLKSSMRDKETDFNNQLAQERAKLQDIIDDTKKQQVVILQEVERSHSDEISRLKEEHALAVKDTAGRSTQELTLLRKQHDDVTTNLKSVHSDALSRLRDETSASHKRALERLGAEKDAELERERLRHATALSDKDSELEQVKVQHLNDLEELQQQHLAELEAAHDEQSRLAQQLESYKVTVQNLSGQRSELLASHDAVEAESNAKIRALEEQLSNSLSEQEMLSAKAAEYRDKLDHTLKQQSQLIAEASNRDSLINELEKHRSVLAEAQENLQKVKDEKDTLQSEKNRQDHVLKELQAQMSRASSPPIGRSPLSTPRPVNSPAAKLPPPTPPPSVPPPPAPRFIHHPEPSSSMSSQSSILTRDSQLPDTPMTSVNGHLPTLSTVSDSAAEDRIVEQARQLDEQEAMIKTLNKQLMHCETDLQAHMDIVSTLETSLGDSEKNLRKAKMQATELARERDTLNTKLEALRTELQEAKREVASVRRSVVEEKHSLEQRLDEERKAKERVRAQLDQRMDELTKRKSKFACL